MRKSAFHGIFIGAFFIFALAGTHAQTLTTLLTFSDTSGSYPFAGTNGAYPTGSLIMSGSTLYGMTSAGGLTGDGTVFGINTDSSGYRDMLDFSGTNGSNPQGGLTIVGSTLYGTANGGGNSLGTAFSISTNGSGFQTLSSFDSTLATDPVGNAALMPNGSVLYGLSAYSGTANSGTLYSINTDGSGFQSLFSFNSNLRGGLTLSGSRLFGTTNHGEYNSGSVFSINTDGSGFQTLLAFTGTNGANPPGNLVFSGSTLYGVTEQGGAYDDGMIFSLNSDGTGYKDLLDFSGTNGMYPTGGLALSGTTLYGTAGGGVLGGGELFSIGEDGSGFQTLYSFNSNNPGSGIDPTGTLLLNGSTLYGVTQSIPASAAPGTVFALNLTPTPEPSSLALLDAAAIGFVGYGWRRRRTRQETKARTTSRKSCHFLRNQVGEMTWSVGPLECAFTLSQIT